MDTRGKTSFWDGIDTLIGYIIKSVQISGNTFCFCETSSAYMFAEVISSKFAFYTRPHKLSRELDLLSRMLLVI